jgi:hypothetical protein
MTQLTDAGRPATRRSRSGTSPVLRAAAVLATVTLVAACGSTTATPPAAGTGAPATTDRTDEAR